MAWGSTLSQRSENILKITYKVVVMGKDILSILIRAEILLSRIHCINRTYLINNKMCFISEKKIKIFRMSHSKKAIIYFFPMNGIQRWCSCDFFQVFYWDEIHITWTNLFEVNHWVALRDLWRVVQPPLYLVPKTLPSSHQETIKQLLPFPSTCSS